MAGAAGLASIVVILALSGRSLANASWKNAWITVTPDKYVNALEPSDTLPIFEDVPTGYQIAVVHVNAQKGDTVSITTDNDQLHFNSTGSFPDFVVTMTISLDYEDQKQVIVTIKLNGGNTKYLVLDVKDVNDNAPMFVDTGSQVNLDVEENTLKPSLLVLAATDGDDGATPKLTYTYQTINPDVFKLTTLADSSGPRCQLELVKKLDFETNRLYKLSVSALDEPDARGTVHNTTITVFVNVKDVGDTPPRWLQAPPAKTINENEAKERTLLYTVQAVDGDTEVNNPIVYSLLNASQPNTVDIDKDSGKVTLLTDLDREDPSLEDSQGFITVTVQAQEKGQSCSNITCVQSDGLIQVIDVDDNDPVLDQDTYSVEVPEGSTSPLGLQLNVTDKDSRYPNGAFLITLNNDPAGVFSVTSSKGVRSLITDVSIVDSTYLDFEVRQSIAFQVVATGDNPGKRSTTAQIFVNLTDINDNRPQFENEVYTVNITEDSANGSSVITVKATDKDKTKEFGTDSIRFSLSGGRDSALEIDAKNGEITMANQDSPVFDYDSGDRQFTYTIHARDNGGTGNSATAQLVVRIMDVDDQPPTLQPLPTLNVTENDSNTEITHSIVASDPDTAAQLNFSINWDASSATKDGKQVKAQVYQSCFKITTNPDAGGAWASLSTTDNILDREKVDTVLLAIMVTDTQTKKGVSSATTTATIQVLDQNDNSPTFTNINSSSRITVTENWPPKVLITTIMAEDPDQDNQITYTVGGDSKYTGLVSIDPSNGQLTVARNIDRETYQKLELVFTATDSGSPPRNTSLKLDLQVEDLNDCVPEWVTDPTDLTVSVLEGNATGDVIATVSATDGDKPNTPASTVTYRLTGEAKQNLTIHPSSGQVKVQGLLDRELLAETAYTLTVRVEAGDECQDVNCVHSIASYLRVKVNDTNDNRPVLPPPSDTPLVKIDETKPAGSDVGSVKGTDADAAGTPAATLTFSLGPVTALRTGCHRTSMFNVSSEQNTAKLTTVGSLHGCWGEYNVTLTATDGEYPFFNTSEVYRAQVVDVNDKPVFVWPEEGFQILIYENIYNGSIAQMPVPLPNGTAMVMKAQDDDDPQLLNSVITYNLLPSSTPSIATTTFAVDPNDGTLYLKSEVDRESKAGYQFKLDVQVHDQGANGGMSATRSIGIVIQDVDEYLPEFSDRQNDETRFTENKTAGLETQLVTSNATDRDATPIIFYFVVGGAKSTFDLVSSSSLKLKTLKIIDRDPPSPPEYQLILQTTRKNKYPGDVDEFDPDNKQLLNMTIIIQDINDNPPHLQDSFMAGIAAGDQKGVITAITAEDLDLNDTISYTIVSNFTSEDPTLQPILESTPPFLLDPSSGNLKLNFDVDPGMTGWIDFKVSATDNAHHTDTSPVRVFIITDSDRVRFVFANPKAIVTASQYQIIKILSDVFKFTADIGRIQESEVYPRSTDVITHFIDQSNPTKPVPVAGNVIVNKQFDGDNTQTLIDKFHDIALNLTHIDDNKVVPKKSEDTVYQMLLIVAASVLGGLLAITLTAACIQVKKLRRQVKALSIDAFGSRDSGLQKAGLTVPGSNVYANEGTNPVFSMDEKPARGVDAESQSSGDSVLIGVEDDPEFRGYNPRSKAQSLGPETNHPSHNTSRQCDIQPAVFDETMRMPHFEADDDDGFDGRETPFPGSEENSTRQNPLFGADL